MLKSYATGGYYVDGKGCIVLSANVCFFGVNIDPSIPHDLKFHHKHYAVFSFPAIAIGLFHPAVPAACGKAAFFG